MLIAELENQLVDARNVERGRPFVCPGCHLPVRLRRGSRVQPYFAHLPGALCPLQNEAESQQHVQGKRQLMTFFAAWGQPELERILPKIQQRADVWLARKQPIALEFQCSPISRAEVASRTAGYRQLGVYPMWLLGKRYAKQRLTWRTLDRFASWLPGWGLCLLFWDVETCLLRVDHHLCQAATGQLSWGTSYLQDVTDLQSRSGVYLATPRPNLLAFRRQLTADLQRESAGLRDVQEAVYLTGHHLAGFPEELTTMAVTPPGFGKGLLLWRVVMTAWLFQTKQFDTQEVRRLSRAALILIGGQLQAIRFNVAPALQRAETALLQDWVRLGKLERRSQGWQVIGQPQWTADLAAYLVRSAHGSSRGAKW
ncbi:competence protein CoiA [Levilactobacillus yonginensis]